jgi:hypothetical protein
MTAGFCRMAAGVLGLESPAWWMGLAAAAMWGVGIGLVVPASNLLVATVAAKHGAAQGAEHRPLLPPAPRLLQGVRHADRRGPRHAGAMGARGAGAGGRVFWAG